MAAAGYVVPIVSGIHWDDIVQKWKLKISWELISPLGNKRGEEFFTLGTLIDVIAKIYELWPGASLIDAGTKFAAPVGDTTVFAALLAEGPAVEFEYPPTPGAYSDDTEYSTVDEYDGTSTNWGATP